MTQARLAQRQPRKLAVKINVRASAAECVFFTRPRNSSDRNVLTKHETFALHSNLFGNRALPGQAGRSQDEPGSGSGRLPASRSIWQASEKQLIRLHETHTFERDLQNYSFRLRETTTFRTPSTHLPWMTSARITPRHRTFFRAEKSVTPLRRNALFSPARKNVTSKIPLLTLKGQRAQMSRTDFQPIWNSPELPPSRSEHALAGPAEF